MFTLLQVARSLLANCLGYWHSIRDNKIDTQRHAGQIVVTVHVRASIRALVRGMRMMQHECVLVY